MDQHVNISVVELIGCSEYAADVTIYFAFEMLS